MKTNQTIQNKLSECGIKKGDTIYFEFKGFQEQCDNLDLIKELRLLVGDEGLLVMPTCTSQQGIPKPVFNPVHTSSEMGVLSEIFRGQQRTHRSNHPTHSLAAQGKDADLLTKGHKYAYGRQTPWGESALGFASPWERLFERDAWCVLIAPDWQISPVIHYASACFVEMHQGFTKESVFPYLSPDWLESHFGRISGAWEGTWNSQRIWVFHLKTAVAGLLTALEDEAEECVSNDDFKAWLAIRRWVEVNGHLNAGVSKVVITPTVPFPRWEGKPMTGVYRDLYARTLLLQSGKNRFALVVCDLIGITADLTQTIRDLVKIDFPQNPPEVMVVCTHAHSTPDTIGAGFASEELLNGITRRISLGILQAAQKMQPVRMGWSKTPIRGLAHSRRMKLHDGKVYTTRYGVPSTWRVNSEVIESQGKIDPELTVLRFETLSGEVLAVVSNFGVHPNIALASSLASGDLNGEAMYILEQAIGGNSIAFSTTGAAGDVDPTLEMPYWGPRTEANVTRLSRILAAQVLEALERTVVEDLHSVQVSSRKGQVKMRQDWLDLMQTDHDRMKSEFPEAGEPSQWIARSIQDGYAEVEVQAVRLGNLRLVAFPGEVFVRTALSLKQVQDNPLVVLETTNDYIGYLPPEEEFAEGGYECDQHFASRVYPEAEQHLRKLAIEAISGLNLPSDSIPPEDTGRCGQLTQSSSNEYPKGSV